VPRDDVEAFAARWLDAQNTGDFAGYSALYAADFRGVRRSGKQTVRMDRAKWLAGLDPPPWTG
jgi:ketosteroid isomerase-like protein